MESITPTDRKAYQRAWREKNREAISKRQADWYAANAERIRARVNAEYATGETAKRRPAFACPHTNRLNRGGGLCGSCWQTARRRRTPEDYQKYLASTRSHRRKRTYGLSEAEFQAMLEQQGGVCAICHQPETRIIGGRLCGLSVDHVHGTNPPVVRGLLCNLCNGAIGYLRNDPAIAAAAAIYLNR